ncbi:hypothetical protein X739_29610 [Mesorhizobium sp. LNHC220B00]|uniref:hypothetical protein n=1 Tax=Mesorhizobium sp. LNHC229A00 TaxID=1287240 RepID=UPI0003CEB681|nr:MULTISPECIES: hypothetical protein [unclassified Mesorhizobium]ESY79924.1 hypothetical protein X739_29610 [Mesorhizobium sp. LNHC220B00]
MKEPGKTKAHSTSQPQIDKFREASRELKIDQSDAAFEADVQKIAHSPKMTKEQIKELVRQKRKGS